MAERCRRSSLLAGGEARRFPGKARTADRRRADGRALSIERVRATRLADLHRRERPFSREIDALLDAPLLVDRDPGAGRSRAFSSACATIRAERVFAVAARSAASRRGRAANGSPQRGEPATKRSCPSTTGAIEPLAALYDAPRVAARRLRRSRRRQRRDARPDRTCSRALRRRAMAAYFHNVNRAEDLAECERSR